MGSFWNILEHLGHNVLVEGRQGVDHFLEPWWCHQKFVETTEAVLGAPPRRRGQPASHWRISPRIGRAQQQ